MSKTINISIVGVTVENKGKTNHMTAAYRDLESNKLDGKKLVEYYTAPDVWKTLLNAKPNDTFSVDMEKENSYWVWKAVHRQDGVASPPVATTPTQKATTQTRSNYETPEERAARQIMIVRQSSIASAVGLLAPNKIVDPSKVLEIAAQFEAFVLNQKAAVESIAEDIPY